MSSVAPENPATILDWMQASALGEWVASSPSGYYVALGFHAIGLAMLVGTMMVINLRLLGGLQAIQLIALQRLSRFAWTGFAINALSGVALFFSEANKMFYADVFRWKILLVFTGVLALTVMGKTVLRPIAAAGAVVTASAKLQAVLSIAIWIAVIIVGRFIAYLVPEVQMGAELGL
jgi:hypothetical protein